MRGYCKWWKTDRGYGFITGEDQQEYFVHYSDVAGEGRKDLVPYGIVEFTPEKNAKGLKATQVTVASVDINGGMNESTQDTRRETGTGKAS